MISDEIRDLNEQYDLLGRFRFEAGPNGLALAEISNAQAQASISLLGAQVLRWQPNITSKPVLWLSEKAIFANGSSIRGGIPICWPWFGPHPDDASKPAHGFVRTRPWRVLAAAATSDGTTEMRFGLSDDVETLQLWPQRFELEFKVVVGETLSVTLISRNTGEIPLVYTGALHSYFTIGDIAQTRVHGLSGTEYIDKVDGGVTKTQTGPVTFSGEVDRVYLDTVADCVIEDSLNDRAIRIAKQGSSSTVVWNPWIEKNERLRDMKPGEYRSMVCVETTNAGSDVITIPPGGEHQLQAIISVE